MTVVLKIWLGDLGAYNAGELKGEWLEFPMDPEELSEKIKQYSRNGEGDYFIADSEEPIKGLVKEFSDPLELNEVADKLSDMRDDELARVGYLVEDQGYSIGDALDKYEDVTFYEGMSLKQVAEHMVDEGLFGEIASSIINYIDYEAIARDLSIDGYTETKAGVFHYC